MNETKRSTQSLIHSKKWEADLRRQIAKYFEGKGKLVSERYPYIIEKRSDKDWHENIILERVWTYIEEQKKQHHAQKLSFALHKYDHHGLSSQGFLFNLLGPLVVDKQWHILDEIIHQAGIQLSTNITNAKFEVEDRGVFNEQQTQPTSIDLFLYTVYNENVFI